MQKLLTSNFIVTVLLVCAGFFAFSLSVFAQAGSQECEVTSAEWRAAGASYLQNFFQTSDVENPPYFYLDIQTQNCVGDTIDIIFHTLAGPSQEQSFDYFNSLAYTLSPASGFIESVISIWGDAIQYFIDEITDIGFIYIGPQVPDDGDAVEIYHPHRNLPSLQNYQVTNANFTVAMKAGLSLCYEGTGDNQQITDVDRCNIAVLILEDGVAWDYSSFMSVLYDQETRDKEQLSQMTTQATTMLNGVLAMTGWLSELFPPMATNTAFSLFYDDMLNIDMFSYYCPDMSGAFNDCLNNVLFQTPQVIDYGAYTPDDPGYAQITAAEDTGIDYTPLSQGLPGFDTGEEIGFGQFLAIIFNVLLIAAGVLAFVMLIIGAFQYMSIDSISGKEGGKEKMLNALLGLLLALGAWVILNTINPQLTTNLGLQIDGVVLETGGDINLPAVSTSSQTLQQTLASFGAYCPGTGGSSVVAAVAASFDDHVTYRLGGKGGPPPYQYETKPCPNGSCGSYCPANQLCVDCSGFANIVRQCAGLPSVGASTGTIFTTANNRENIEQLTNNSVNGIDLVPGDLLGWLEGDSANGFGHVIIYIGDGRAVETTSNGGVGRTTPGAAFQERPVTYYGDQLKYIVRTN